MDGWEGEVPCQCKCKASAWSQRRKLAAFPAESPVSRYFFEWEMLNLFKNIVFIYSYFYVLYIYTQIYVSIYICVCRCKYTHGIRKSGVPDRLGRTGCLW